MVFINLCMYNTLFANKSSIYNIILTSFKSASSYMHTHVAVFKLIANTLYVYSIHMLEKYDIANYYVICRALQFEINRNLL